LAQYLYQTLQGSGNTPPISYVMFRIWTSTHRPTVLTESFHGKCGNRMFQVKILHFMPLLILNSQLFCHLMLYYLCA